MRSLFSVRNRSSWALVALIAGALACGSAAATAKAPKAKAPPPPPTNVVDITPKNMSDALNPTASDQVTFVLSCEVHRVDCQEALDALNHTAELAKSGQITDAAKNVRFFYFNDNFKNAMELQDFCAQFQAHAAGAYLCDGASWDGPAAYIYQADAKRQRHGMINKGDDLTAVLRAFTTPTH